MMRWSIVFEKTTTKKSHSSRQIFRRKKAIFSVEKFNFLWIFRQKMSVGIRQVGKMFQWKRSSIGSRSLLVSWTASLTKFWRTWGILRNRPVSFKKFSGKNSQKNSTFLDSVKISVKIGWIPSETRRILSDSVGKKIWPIQHKIQKLH